MRRIWFSLLARAALGVLYWPVFVGIAYSLLAGDARDGGSAAGTGAVIAIWVWGLAIWLIGLWLLFRSRAWRPLTPGELAAAGAVFGDAIDWDRVRIYARGFTPFQPRRIAVSPLGAVHFRREDFLADYATDPGNMAWLIHELAHVWQYQTGVWVILRGLWERRYHYGDLDPAKPLPRYGIEQQAAIVEDWYLRTQGQPGRRGTGSEAAYRAVIPFLPR